MIAFLSHDDLWTPDKLVVQVNHLQAHPECQYTVSRIRYFLETGYAPPAGFRKALFAQEPVAYIMETLVARRSLFVEVGLYAPDLSTAEDVDWFARVFDAGQVGYACDQVLVWKRVHDSNTSLGDCDNNRQVLLAIRRSLQRKRSG